MCGIIGYLAKGKQEPSQASFEKAVDQLTHRGPDKRGLWREQGVALGFRRLSVIDLETGDQPMSNEDGSLQIVFNGEIYNFAEIRRDLEARGHLFKTRSDTEVILHLFEDKGEACVQLLRGMFAFAIYNRRDKSLFLARDRFGKKPLVYIETAHGFFFASEIPPLMDLSGCERHVDAAAINCYLALSYVPGTLTAWREIRRLGAAHTMTVRGGIAQPPQRYWQLDWSHPLEISMPEAKSQLRGVLEESVRLRLVADVPVGAFLSGGVDSSIVAAAMKQSGAHVQTFCLGFNEVRFDESKHARQVAHILGTDHHELRVSPDALDVLDPLVANIGEPFADQSLLPTHLLSKFTRQHVTVALSGDGGDELFAGYKRYAHLEKARRIDALGMRIPWLAASRVSFFFEQIFNSSRRGLRWPRAAIDRILGMKPLDQHLSLVGAWSEAQRKELLCSGFEANGARKLFQEQLALHKSVHGTSRWQALDCETYLVDDIMRKVDAASMASSLECRSPLLDHKVAELASKLPLSVKQSGSTTKSILRELYPELPPTLFDREKKGFSLPLGHWFRHQWQTPFQDCFGAVRPKLAQSFDCSIIDRLSKEHKEGRHDHSGRLYNWFVLCKWTERFDPIWPQ